MELRPAISARKLLTIIAVLIPLAYFLRLNSYQLIFEEPRRALVALEMMLADNWLVPTTNGALYYNKPPLYNWILICFLKIFGTSEWVVRLPSVLSLLITSLIHFRISKCYIGKKAALLSTLFYLTSADILFYFSLLGEIDLFYALIVYLQGLLIFHFYQKRNWAALFLLSYLLTSAGVLTKGIPSLVFQAISLLLIFAINRDFKRMFSGWHFAGILLLILSSGGYFYSYSLHSDVAPYLARLFTETFSRSGMERSATDNLLHLLNFPLMILKIAAPWCLLALFAFNRQLRENLLRNSFLAFALWFCLANGAVYWLSPGTRERYLYMFFPFLYALLAVLVTRIAENNIWLSRFHKAVSWLLVAGIIGLAVFGFIQHQLFPAILCVLIATSAFILLYRFRVADNQNLLLTTVAFVLLARVAFDLVVLPTRKQHEPYRSDAMEMAKIIGRERIWFAGEPERKKDEVRLAGQHFLTFERDEPSFLAFQTSYYLSAATGHIVNYTPEIAAHGYYIIAENDPRTEGKKVLYRFNNRAGNEDHWFILFQQK